MNPAERIQAMIDESERIRIAHKSATRFIEAAASAIRIAALREALQVVKGDPQ